MIPDSKHNSFFISNESNKISYGFISELNKKNVGISNRIIKFMTQNVLKDSIFSSR